MEGYQNHSLAIYLTPKKFDSSGTTKGLECLFQNTIIIRVALTGDLMDMEPRTHFLQMILMGQNLLGVNVRHRRSPRDDRLDPG